MYEIFGQTKQTTKAGMAGVNAVDNLFTMLKYEGLFFSLLMPMQTLQHFFVPAQSSSCLSLSQTWVCVAII